MLQGFAGCRVWGFYEGFKALGVRVGGRQQSERELWG